MKAIKKAIIAVFIVGIFLTIDWMSHPTIAHALCKYVPAMVESCGTNGKGNMAVNCDRNGFNGKMVSAGSGTCYRHSLSGWKGTPCYFEYSKPLCYYSGSRGMRQGNITCGPSKDLEPHSCGAFFVGCDGGDESGDDGGEEPEPTPVPPPTPTPIPAPIVEVTNPTIVHYFWNSKDIAPNTELPDFDIQITNLFGGTLTIKVNTPKGEFATYTLSESDIKTIATVEGNTYTVKINESTIKTIEMNMGLTCNGTWISQCPVNSDRSCWGTTLGKCVRGGEKPSDAIGIWTAEITYTNSAGVSSETKTASWNVKFILISE